MSRTYLINGTPTESTGTASHENQTALARAMANPTSGEPLVRFYFSPTDFACSAKVEQLRTRMLNSLSFMADAYLQGALSSLLNDYYRHSKETESAEKFVDYQTFLDHIAGYEASVEALYATGLDVQSHVDAIRTLTNFREEVHAAIAMQLRDPTTYEIPNFSEKLANPIIRKVSARAEEGYRELARDDATDENGVIDVELEKEIFETYKQAAKFKKIDAYNFDKMKAKSLVALYACIKADASTIDDDSDAFDELDARRQYGMILNLRNTLNQARIDVVEDNRLNVPEKAALRVESKAMIRELEKLMAHDRFAEF